MPTTPSRRPRRILGAHHVQKIVAKAGVKIPLSVASELYRTLPHSAQSAITRASSVKKRALPFRSSAPNLPNTRHPVSRSAKYMSKRSLKKNYYDPPPESDSGFSFYTLPTSSSKSPRSTYGMNPSAYAASQGASKYPTTSTFRPYTSSQQNTSTTPKYTPMDISDAMLNIFSNAVANTANTAQTIQDKQQYYEDLVQSAKTAAPYSQYSIISGNNSNTSYDSYDPYDPYDPYSMYDPYDPYGLFDQEMSSPSTKLTIVPANFYDPPPRPRKVLVYGEGNKQKAHKPSKTSPYSMQAKTTRPYNSRTSPPQFPSGQMNRMSLPKKPKNTL